MSLTGIKSPGTIFGTFTCRFHISRALSEQVGRQQCWHFPRDFSHFQVPGLVDFFSPGTTGPRNLQGLQVLSCPHLVPGPSRDSPGRDSPAGKPSLFTRQNISKCNVVECSGLAQKSVTSSLKLLEKQQKKFVLCWALASRYSFLSASYPSLKNKKY